MGNRVFVKLSPVFCIMLAMMLLILPLKWLLAAVIAAMYHELCHIVAIRLCHGTIHKLSFSTYGARLDISELSAVQELLCSLAGPAGGLCLLFFSKWIPRIAVCAAFQSIYNLLPIYPLDGGRALLCGISLFLTEEHAWKFCKFIEVVCIGIVILIVIYAVLFLKLGISPLLPAVFIITHTKFRKTPCKQRLQRLQ